MRKKINNKVVSIVVALALVCGVVMSAFAANDYVNPTFIITKSPLEYPPPPPHNIQVNKEVPSKIPPLQNSFSILCI